jgi:hypothetical protein
MDIMRTPSQSNFANILVSSLLVLIMGAGIGFPINALAHDNSKLPSQGTQPTPATQQSCELADGSWEACYQTMCLYE